MITLGVHAYTHDSAAALVCDGKVIGAAEEERFDGRKHSDAFPRGAIAYCLDEAGISLRDVDEVGVAWSPMLQLHLRLLAMLRYMPASLRGLFPSLDGRIDGSLRIWSSIWRLPNRILREFGPAPRTRFSNLVHHDCHAASAFLASPAEEAAILTCDACGEWDTTVCYSGRDSSLERLEAESMPHSLGLVYSALTQFLGFKVKSDEGKVMALAGMGKRSYRAEIARLMALDTEGRLEVDPAFFRFQYDTKGLFYSPGLVDLFGPAQTPGRPPSERDADIATSLQELTEEVLARKLERLRERTGATAFCIAGGVALNSKANGRMVESGVVDRLWVQPAANDAGAALGAAAARVLAGNRNTAHAQCLLSLPRARRRCQTLRGRRRAIRA